MVTQQRGNGMTERVGDEQTSRAAIDVTEFLAAKGHNRRVHDRKHLFDVIEEQAIQEDFVRVLQLPEIDMALQIVGLLSKGLVSAPTLSVERLHDGREKAVQAEGFSFRFVESGTLIQGRIIE